MMKWYIASLAVLVSFMSESVGAQVNGFGYIRIVLTSNESHYDKVQLLANGSKLGKPFDHTLKNDSWQPVRAENLSAGSNRTPILTRYSFPTGSTCKFDYYVEFSFDGKSVAARMGPFHAPQTESAGDLPLGRGCKAGLAVCSSDPVLQQQMVRAHNTKLRDNYNRWKADFDARVKLRSQRNIDDQEAIARELLKRTNEDFERGGRVLGEHVAEWERQLAEYQADLLTQQQSVDVTVPENEFAAEEVVDLSEAALESARDSQLASQNFPDGDTKSLFRQLDEGIEDAKWLQQVIREEEIRNGEWDAEDRRFHRKFNANMEALQRDILRGGIAKEVGKGGVKATIKLMPSWMKQGVKLCELVRGREMCVGDELTYDQMTQKICELKFYWAAKPFTSAARLLEMTTKGTPSDYSSRLAISKTGKEFCE